MCEWGDALLCKKASEWEQQQDGERPAAPAPALSLQPGRRRRSARDCFASTDGALSSRKTSAATLRRKKGGDDEEEEEEKKKKEQRANVRGVNRRCDGGGGGGGVGGRAPLTLCILLILAAERFTGAQLVSRPANLLAAAALDGSSLGGSCTQRTAQFLDYYFF